MAGLHLTPEILERSYELLRATRPFSAWRLPEADDVEFHVLRTRRVHGDCSREAGGFVVRISQAHSYLPSLLATMAHEMCHMRAVPDVSHGSAFKKLAAQVCKFHGFDPGSF